MKRLIIRERYNATANSYDELYREEQYEKYQVTLRYVYPKDTVLLDAGCGTALFAEFLHDHPGKHQIKYYLCLDFSEAMIEIAKKRLSRLKLNYLSELIIADVEHLPLRKNSVDEVYAFTVFFLTDNEDVAITESCRVSKKRVVYTVLKRVPRLHITFKGKLVAETAKDLIFLVDKASKGYC